MKQETKISLVVSFSFFLFFLLRWHLDVIKVLFCFFFQRHQQKFYFFPLKTFLLHEKKSCFSWL